MADLAYGHKWPSWPQGGGASWKVVVVEMVRKRAETAV